MEIKFDFQPSRLKTFVHYLEKTIKVPTGIPKRLDREDAIKALHRYHESQSPADMPGIIQLERVSDNIGELFEIGLKETYFLCIDMHCSGKILANLITQYFNDYTDDINKSFLLAHIDHFQLLIPEWERWINLKSAFFADDPIKELFAAAAKDNIEFDRLASYWGLKLPYRIRDDAIRAFFDDTEILVTYLKGIDSSKIIKLLNNYDLQIIHTKIWDVVLPLFVSIAKEIKIENNEDHEIFSLAKIRLEPPKSAKWHKLSEKAQTAYKEWAIGSQLESIFYFDPHNHRVRFWKQYITQIDEITEIQQHDYTEAISMSIGKYLFIEFREMGAIYVYPKGSVSIPNTVSNLDHLKFRNLIVNAGVGKENGEGWIPHLGATWYKYAEKMVQRALQK
jgi:hypothetical protein